MVYSSGVTFCFLSPLGVSNGHTHPPYFSLLCNYHIHVLVQNCNTQNCKTHWLVSSSGYCLFLDFLFGCPAALILVVPSGLVTGQAGCIAIALGLPAAIILGIPSVSLLWWIPYVLGPMCLPLPWFIPLFLRVDSSFQNQTWEGKFEVLHFSEGHPLFFSPLHCPYKVLSQAC